MLIFDLQSLKDLLVHYTEGAVPLSSEAVGFSVSPVLQRYLCLEVASPEWSDHEVGPDGLLVPLTIRYEGNRVLKLQRPQDAGPEAWGDPGAVEAPKQQ